MVPGPRASCPHGQEQQWGQWHGGGAQKGLLSPLPSFPRLVAMWGLWGLRLILASLSGWDPAGWSCCSSQGLGSIPVGPGSVPMCLGMASSALGF